MALPHRNILRQAAREHAQNFIALSDMETLPEAAELLHSLLEETAIGLYLLVGTDMTVKMLKDTADQVLKQPARASTEAERSMAEAAQQATAAEDAGKTP